MVGEDIPAGEYVFSAEDAESIAILSVEERDELFGSVDGGSARCGLNAGETVSVTGSGLLTPYMNTLTTDDVQSVGNVEFLLPPGWTPSMEDGYLYAYTEATGKLPVAEGCSLR